MSFKFLRDLSEERKIYIFLIITILSYLFKNHILFLIFYLYAAASITNYLMKISIGIYIMAIVIGFTFILTGAVYLNISYYLNNIDILYSLWLTFIIIDVPYLLYSFINKYISNNKKIMNIIKPISKEEIYREDSIIIGVVGFLQTFVTITFTGEQVQGFKILAILSFFVFVITRGIAIIKDNWYLRAVSLYSIISMIIMDIVMYTLNYILKSEILSNIMNILNIPVDFILIIFLLYILMSSIQIFDEIIKNRYSL